MTTTSTRKKEKEKSRSSQRKSSRRSNRERRNNNGTECLIAITAVALVLFLLGQLLIMLFGGTPSIRLHSSAVVAGGVLLPRAAETGRHPWQQVAAGAGQRRQRWPPSWLYHQYQ